MIRSVAVVDDSTEFQHLATVMFSYLGIQDISVWDNSTQAFNDLSAQPCDVILLDVMMAGMSGLDVWSKLRQTPQTRQVPIIVCTAAVNRIVEHETRLHDDQHTYLLPKPFTLDDLREALEYLVPHWKN